MMGLTPVNKISNKERNGKEWDNKNRILCIEFGNRRWSSLKGSEEYKIEGTAEEESFTESSPNQADSDAIAFIECSCASKAALG